MKMSTAKIRMPTTSHTVTFWKKTLLHGIRQLRTMCQEF